MGSKQLPEIVSNFREKRKTKQNVNSKEYESIRPELPNEVIETCSRDISTLEEPLLVKDTAVGENSLRRSKRVRNNQSVLNQRTFYGENEENESINISRRRPKTTQGKIRKNPLA